MNEYEKLLAQLKKDLSEALGKEFFERDDVKALLKDHTDQKDMQPNSMVDASGEPVKFAQTARFIRALARDDKATLEKIQLEEAPKYMRQFGFYEEINEKAITNYINETTAAQGGNLVPIEYYMEVFRIVCAYGIARRDCLILPMNSQQLKVPTVTALPNTYWVGEFELKTHHRPTFGQVALSAVDHVSIIPFTEQVLADATPPLIQLIVTLASEAFKKGEDTALFSGNGGAGITGILADATVNTVVMPAGMQSFANITFDDICDLPDATTCESDEGGAYYFHKNILTHLRKIKDLNNNYVLQPAIGDKPASLWGYPYYCTSVLPGNASDAKNTAFMVFGNLKRSVFFGDRQSLTVKLLTEATIAGTNLAEYNLQALRFVERLDIEVALGGAISILKTAP